MTLVFDAPVMLADIKKHVWISSGIFLFSLLLFGLSAAMWGRLFLTRAPLVVALPPGTEIPLQTSQPQEPSANWEETPAEPASATPEASEEIAQPAISETPPEATPEAPSDSASSQPAASPDVAPADSSPPPPPPPPPTVILFVDDEAPARELAKSALTMEGTVLVCAEESDAGLAEYDKQTGPVGLVVLPLVTLEMTGDSQRIFDELRKRKPDQKILFTTASLETMPIPPFLKEAVGIAFLPKPLTPRSLAEKALELMS